MTNTTPRLVKCVVWDLDGTLWPGVQAEGDPIAPLPAVLVVIDGLAVRGIVNSVASRNDPAAGARLLAAPELAGRFVAPRISWEPKDQALREIARELNIGVDSLAFVDDNAFERASIEQLLPGVLVLSPDDIPTMLDRPELGAGVGVTSEGARRAEMYAEEERRRQAEQQFSGNRLDFLRSCDMRLLVRPAVASDLPRINEMVARTNQLNSTGQRYSPDEVTLRLNSPHYILPVALLTDRFGDYGLIGSALVDTVSSARWTVELLMLSCRVEGRGIPAALLRLLLDATANAGVPELAALYRRTEQNRQMLLLLRSLGFRAAAGDHVGAAVPFVRSTTEPLPPLPEWLQINPQPLRTTADG